MRSVNRLFREEPAAVAAILFMTLAEIVVGVSDLGRGAKFTAMAFLGVWLFLAGRHVLVRWRVYHGN